MMWAEWLSSSRTIVFLTISLRVDYSMITSFFACIVFGFLPIIPQPQCLDRFVCHDMYPCSGAALVFICPTKSTTWRYRTRVSGRSLYQQQERQEQQLLLAYRMTGVCPFFPLNYYLAVTKVIGPEECTGIFILLTHVLKAFFAASLADAHAHALVDAKHTLEEVRQANKSRRALLKHLLHEVRTPVNSLTMGI